MFLGVLQLMLDNRDTSTGPLKPLTETWLVKAMCRGDMARILEPLLLTLLDPSTARVSVLHCKIDQCDAIEANNNGSSDERSNPRMHKVPALQELFKSMEILKFISCFNEL